MEDKSKEYGQLNFTLPHDVVPLPSNGIFYSNKKKSVKVGYLTAQEENILMSGADDITLLLLRNVLYEPELKIESLIEGDVEAILVFLRNSSFGPEMVLNLKDPVGGKPFQETVHLDVLPVIKGVEPNNDGTFSTILPKTKSSVKLRPLTYGEILELNKLSDRYPKNMVIPKVTEKLSRQIVEIDGSSDRETIIKFVTQMPISDSKHIKKFMDENEPRLDMTKHITAPSGEKLTVNVGFGADFFRPFF